MASGDVAYGECHGQDRQTECEHTPSKPTPTFGNVAASRAVPQPPKTSQKVPMNSAVPLLVRVIFLPAVPMTGVGYEIQNLKTQWIPGNAALFRNSPVSGI